MKHCAVHPIPLYLVPFNKSDMLHFPSINQPVFVAVYIWYIEGSEEKILVDSGVDMEHSTKAGPPPHMFHTIESGLQSVGINIGDITLIIQTHLHFDHVAFASKFPNARILVQKRELEFARNPHPMCEPLYDRKLFDNLKFEEIDGDCQISEDIKVLFTPGHSPGGQSVCIWTEEGMAIIAGLCTIMDNFYPPTLPNGETPPVIIPKIHTNIFEAYDSLVRIKEMADIILPIHDSISLTRKVIK